MAQAAEQIQQIVEAMARLSARQLPPPLPYKGVGNINDFFTTFERHAESLYGNDPISYLQTLHQFLEGEPREIAVAFGSGAGVTYEAVKERLITEFTTARTLGNNQYSDFFSASRRTNESLVCYSIRLSALASRIPNSNDQSRDVMVKSKFLGGLSKDISRQVDIHMSNEDNPTLSQIVKLASILEGKGNAPVPPDVKPRVQGGGGSLQANAIGNLPRGNPAFKPKCFACGSEEHIIKDCQVAKNVKCYNCNNLGHISKNCPHPRKQRNNDSASRTASGGNRQEGGTSQQPPQFQRPSQPQQTSQSQPTRPHCGFCNIYGHIMRDCREFRAALVVCVWCGGNHASHTCNERPNQGNFRASK